MFLRIFSAGLAITLLSACGPESGQPEGEPIECAIGPGSDFAEVCTLEKIAEEGAEVLVLHHPDGGFRRFRETDTGLETLDGAATVSIPYAGAPPTSQRSSGYLEFSVAGDRYRLPIGAAAED